MSISYLIPAWKKPFIYLRLALASLRCWDNCSEIVVIGKSCRGEEEEYTRLIKEYSTTFYEVVSMPIFSKAQLLNAAFKRSSGQFVVIYDADFVATERFVGYLFEHSFAAMNYSQCRLSKEASKILLKNYYIEGFPGALRKKSYGSPPVKGLYSYASTSPPTILSREVYAEIGGLCEKIVGWGSEDTDLCWMLEQRGYTPRKYREGIKDAFVYHLWHEGRGVGKRLASSVKMQRRKKMLAGKILQGNLEDWGNLCVVPLAT